ncbi:SMC-Scp complex subunit ScpB [Peribacillus loiseleuriae]|uniref:Segregation and condensation protein B n=1 Tax=Peribacillus loiseleuriae TaxID=1679170 RepID=A0A0K9GVJ0_9BACI|nr:SMC-Scp complex subunit ScpB [Peribacillus loiseleuriae]KMY50646.1 segregation and condensation protein B [Peribacillus loiseleuriae]
MEVINWKGIVEALLFAAGDEGLSLKQLTSVLEMAELQTKEVLQDLKEYYEENESGLQLVEIADVYQLATKKEHSDYIKKLVESSGSGGLSQASLETLAIIAYKQPITRTEIEEIRGVKTDRPLQTLISKALVKEIGRAEGAGRAYLFGTTKEFLDYFGLKTLKELPALGASTEENFEQGEADLFFEKFQETLE